MYDRIINAVFGSPWAITETKMEAIVAFLEAKAAGANFPEFEAQAARPHPSKLGSVAIISIHGIISQRMNMLQQFSGGVSTEQLSDDISAMADDDTVKAIVLDIDSPGGSVYGVEEVAEAIYAAREKKHITALANGMAASAAYWIGAAASEFVVTPSGDVGSIGVITAHTDTSELSAKLGTKTTIIKAGKHKDLGNPHEPLSEEGLQLIQTRVDEYYDTFTGAVAKYRGVEQDAVKNGYGEGAVLGSKAALSAGMVDRIATMDEVLAKLGRKRNSTRAAKVRMI